MFGFGLWLGTALAATPPVDAVDVAARWVEHFTQDEHRIRGAASSSALSLARHWADENSRFDAVDRSLAVESGVDGSWAYALRPSVRLSAGAMEPMGWGGDREPGAVSPRARFDARAYWGPMEAMVAPELGANFGADSKPHVRLPLAWAGLNLKHWRLGFGAEDRWFGPGQHGGLMLTDNARPAPLGSAAWTSGIGRLGAFRAEVGAGILDAERRDVVRPGWLVMDARWSPVQWVEVGATRIGIFGGQGRPMPDIGQLLVPTDPHVYGDPDQLQPDQDEMAALDARVSVPLDRWLPFEALTVWTQYGGEDVIARSIGPIPMPSLAGIANLWGAELRRGPWSAVAEWARVMDDTFRWYTGHRIYHDGFTQEEESMGHPRGGDARSWDVSVQWLGQTRGAELVFHDSLRVGAIDVAQGRLRTLMADERTQELRLNGWLHDRKGWWNAGVSAQRISGVNFVPGQQERSWRVFIGR